MEESSTLNRLTELVERRTRIENQLNSNTEIELTARRSQKRELRFLNRECQRLVSDIVSSFSKSEIQVAVAAGVKRAAV